MLVDLLKLAVVNRIECDNAKETLASVLSALGNANPEIGNMLLEICVTELEDAASNLHNFNTNPQPVVQETSHPYIDDITLTGMHIFKSNLSIS